MKFVATAIAGVALAMSGCTSTSGDTVAPTSAVATTTATTQRPVAGVSTTPIVGSTTPIVGSTTPIVGSTTTTTTTSATTTTRGPSARACEGRKLGTYTWSQNYWRSGNMQLTDFLATEVAHEWNCGDVYINIADVSNYDKIFDQENLAEFMRNFRHLTGNSQTLWLTYGDVVSGEGDKMVAFVETFKKFLEDHISAADMAEMAPVGLSFDVEHVPHADVKNALLSAQQMKVDLMANQGYAEGSLWIQYTIEGAPDALQTEHVMRYADSALMMLYRNEIKDESGNNGDDLLGRMRWMMTEQCQVCTQPGWEQLKAKITVMVEGACDVGDYCHKLSVCAFDSASYPDASGGVQYTWDMLQKLDDLMVPVGIVTQAQYEHHFDHSKTLFAIHNWEWSRCFYGNDFSAQMGYTDDFCPRYHAEAEICRSM